MPKHLLLKRYRGGPEPHHPFPPMDQWAPEDVEAHMAFQRHVAEVLKERGEYVGNQALTPARTPAWGLGDRSVDRQVVEVQPNHLVVAGERGPQHLLTDPGLGPVVESAADGAVRAARGGDAFVAAAVHQGRDHVVEHDPVGDPAAVASPRVGRVELGAVGLDQGSELDPQGLGQGCW